MAAVDYNDPCARLAALQAAYYSLISGQSESLIRYKGPEGEREVRFSAGHIEALNSEIKLASAQCAAASGTPDASRRYSIRGGARSRPRFPYC